MKTIVVSSLKHEPVSGLYHRTFDESEREAVANLAVELLTEKSEPPTLHLGVEVAGDLIGHVSFSPVTRKGSQQHVGYILAPLAVDPDWQKRGVGSRLVRDGLDRVEQEKGGLVFVYGDPAYYSRFGFTAKAAEKYMPLFPLTYPSGWMALPYNAKGDIPIPGTIECVESLSKPGLW